MKFVQLISLLLLIAAGCAARCPANSDVDPVEPPEPTPIVDDGLTSPASTGESLRLSAPASIVAMIHELLGDKGTLSLNAETRKIVRDDVTVTIPSETSATYLLGGEGGTITFAKPWPTVTAKLFAGIKVSPSLVKIVLNADDTVTAHVKSIIGTHKRTFPIGWESETEGTAAANELPVVFAYSAAGCPPCAKAKKDFEDEAKSLPFVVEWRTDPPTWMPESRPAFWWHVKDEKPTQADVANTRRRNGYSTLKDFIDVWKASRNAKAATIGYHAGHACPRCGTEQYAISNQTGPTSNSHTHQCRQCETTWWHSDQ